MQVISVYEQVEIKSGWCFQLDLSGGLRRNTKIDSSRKTPLHTFFIQNLTVVSIRFNNKLAELFLKYSSTASRAPRQYP